MTAMRSVPLAAVWAWLAACELDLERMIEQPRCEVDEPCPGFENGITNRDPPAHVVRWSSRSAGVPSAATTTDGRWLTELPIALERRLIERGRERFDLVCSTCHGLLGNGASEVAKDMTVRPPPSLVSGRVGAYPPGRVFAVITSGYGLMPSYAEQIELRDRWAVIAYLDALRLSQGAALARLPAAVAAEAAPWLGGVGR
jgi:mono/diheme cytochrome c family protein